MRLDYSIPDHHQKVFETISEQARKLGQPVYVVGGYVRDYYLERLKEEPDIDLVTIGSGITLAEKLHKTLKGSSLAVYKQFYSYS